MINTDVDGQKLAQRGAHASLSFFVGVVSWIGELLILFGAYTWFLAGDILLLGLGFSLVCFGEGLALLKRMKPAEIEVLKDTLIKQMAKNMLFPFLWVVLFFLTGINLFLALSIANGAKAIVKNARLVATSYIFS